MTVLVAYATRHGSAREVAEAIAGTLQALGADVELRAARDVRGPDGFVRGQTGSWSLIVLGAPLYSGRWHRDAHRFLRRHRKELAGVPVAVFGGVDPPGKRPRRDLRDWTQIEAWGAGIASPAEWLREMAL